MNSDRRTISLSGVAGCETGKAAQDAALVRRAHEPQSLAEARRLVHSLQARVAELEAPNISARGANIAASLRAGGESVVLDTCDMAVAPVERIARFAQAIDAIDYDVSCARMIHRLYCEVCLACVDGAGFSLAWLSSFDEEAQRLVPMEVAGVGWGYLDSVVAGNGLDVNIGQEPCALAWREGRLYICNDIEALPASDGWGLRARTGGLCSVLALPVYRGGKIYATLAAYGPERNFLDAETVRLLENVVDCLELALDEFDRKERQRLDAERLRHSEERFRILVENLPLKIFVKDASDRYVSCNGLFAQDLGIRPESIAGKTDFDFYSRVQAEQFRREDQSIIATGEGMDLHVSTSQDGVEKIVHIIKTPFKKATGEIVGVIGAIVDITERKQAELKLRQFAYEVEDIYQNAPCGYHSIDADGVFQRINNTELTWLGYRREDVVGQLRLSDLLSEASREIFTDVSAEFKRTGVLQELQLEMVRKDGCILPVSMSATAVYDDEGNFLASRAMVSDISIRRELEREQRMQARRVSELSHRVMAVQEEERRRLAGDLHDRAMPNLVAIGLTIGNLCTNLPDGVREGNREYFDDINALVEDTTASIREICTELRPPLLDYSGLAPTLEAYAQQISRRTGMAVDVATKIEGSPLGRNVESLLFRIVQEAIANSVKHAFAKHIRIELQAGERCSVLTIKDDGVGFDPLLLGSACAVGGMVPGLGLITMRERAEFAGGQLAIHSQSGEGTEIRVEFDAVERRTRLLRRHTDRLQAAIEPLSQVPRQYARSQSERRTGQCRRNPESIGSLRDMGPGFVERRLGTARRKPDQGLQPGLASQFRYS